MLKKGDILYKAWVSLDTASNERCSIEVEEWHVTQVDKSGVFLRMKCFMTWGKLSRTDGDYGWKKNTDPYYRDKINEGEEYKNKGYHKSKSAAYRSQLPELKKKVKELNALVRKIEAQISKLKS